MYTVGHSLSHNVLFFFARGSSGCQLGCTEAEVTAKRLVEYVKNTLQNIITDWTPLGVLNLSD